jgi:dipeptidase E
MKRLFLASSIDKVAKDIAKNIGKDPKILKTAFILTAAEPKNIKEKGLEWLKNDRKGLVDAGFNLFDYTITNKTSEQIEKDLKDCDVIHVNGGHTFYLLLQARKSDFDKFIKKFINNGGIYIGSSAGSIIASPDIAIKREEATKEYDDELKTFEAFNLVNFIIFPHWAREDRKEKYLGHRLENSYITKNKIILLTDTQYVLVEDDMYKIIDINE